MQNPFEQLGKKPIKADDIAYDEWGGQFSCQFAGCNGYANIARYIRKHHLLTWQCQDGHISRMEDVDE